MGFFATLAVFVLLGGLYLTSKLPTNWQVPAGFVVAIVVIGIAVLGRILEAKAKSQSSIIHGIDVRSGETYTSIREGRK